MSKRKLLLRVFTVLLCITLLSADFFASAVLFTFETQYDYDEADVAWLTDLVIKEDMTTVEGMAQLVDIIPVPDYPYTETPDSFAKDVNYFTSLYNLQSNSTKAGYIYFFEVLNTHSEFLAGDVSDSDIEEYFEAVGISYPENIGADELLIARALYAAMVSGSLNGDIYGNGNTMEEVLVAYLASLSGTDINSLKNWMSDNSITTLNDYILAASRMSLWANGYDVTKDTEEDEVYRLVALMTVKAQGITVDGDLPFEELNLKYIAALLGKKYSVFIDSKKLGDAIDDDSVPFYILQLIGKENGVSVREDNATFEEAFNIVAENSDVFDVENDFYADIFKYEVFLSTRTDNIWVYPTAYSTNSSEYSVLVSVDGTAIKNNYYNQIKVPADKEEFELNVVVTASSANDSSTCKYVILVHQGTYAGVEGDDPVTEPGSEEHSYVSSDSLVSNILSGLGVNPLIESVINNSHPSLPSGIAGILAYSAPSFGENSQPSVSVPTEKPEDSFFISVLDDVGAIMDTEIAGIPGIEFAEEYFATDVNPITFE